MKEKTNNKTYVVSPPAIGKDYYIVLTDYIYWSIYEDSLREWCAKNLSLGVAAFKGSVVTCTTEQEFMMFELRWG